MQINPLTTWAMPALLRGAHRAYGAAVRRALEHEGFDDIPRNGVFVLGAIARKGMPLADIIRHLGASKQAAGQLIDTLVMRGYLLREVDANDRRRLTLRLTQRGGAAARIAHRAVEQVDAALNRRVDQQWIEHTRATLAAIIGERDDD